MRSVNAISAQAMSTYNALGLVKPTIPLVTSSAETSSNPIIDYLIVAIIAGVVIGIVWLILRSRKKRV